MHWGAISELANVGRIKEMAFWTPRDAAPTIANVGRRNFPSPRLAYFLWSSLLSQLTSTAR